MVVSLSFGVLFLAVVVFEPVCSYKHVISVDSLLGHDDSSCLPPSSETPCQTLEYVENHLNSVSNNSVLIEICQPQIILSKALHFSDFVNLSIQGESGSGHVEIVCNTSNAGLSFVNVYGLSLSHINISECGVIRHFKLMELSIIEFSALYIINCCDVNITDTVVYRSKGTGITMVDTYGAVSFKSIEAIENSFHLGTNCSISVCEGGRGLYILFYLNTTSDPSPSLLHMQKQCSNANITIEHFTCMSNNASTTEKNTDVCGYTGIGGGTLILLGDNATNVNITINDSVFQDNMAYCGGGLYLAYNSYNRNNHVSFTKTNFFNNRVVRGKFAGGLEVFFLSSSVNGNLKLNTLSVFSSTFENNTEGGVNIWSDDMPTEGDTKAIFFTNCSWANNSAKEHGAAVHIMAGVSVSGTRGHYPAVVFKNCNFFSNKVKPIVVPESNLLTRTNAVGAFYSNVLTVVFEGRTVFEDNSGTALYLSCSIASFGAASSVKFVGNYGTNGGAIALIGRSYLYLEGSSTFSFIDNTATHFGGAIYFQSIDTVVYQPCFIISSKCNEKSSFHFDGNIANSGQGEHIFLSSFGGCSISYCNKHCPGSKPTDLLQCRGNFTFENPSNITTGTLPTNFILNTSLITMYPGLPQQLNIIVSDAEGNVVPNVSYQATLARNTSAISINTHYEYVSNNTISINGEPGKNDTLQLNALLTDISLLINVSLLQCPPGYVFDNTTMTCNCRALHYYGLQKCDPEAYIRRGVWMGKCNNSQFLCTADCPIGFCTYNTTNPTLYHLLPMNVSHLEPAICSSSRKGTICGSCKEGYSV